ncbi:leucine--tRNA ligase [Niabella insulamsoli]|uniref:leucine--tRNA ligase n=1 Tax=Niabella insulamsoli TaxID=3144874 RepID=UPI0031FD01C9
MEYNFNSIEKKWQQAWKDQQAYKVSNDNGRPKFYVLDMFPYPSGAGLHVGHPLGYIASDIYARYKRLKGFNVLHPMGYDAFGLPAEQYAIEHGVHPAVSTQKNIETFRRQLDNIGFSFDWSREVRTSDPQYYRWTQWIFLQLFNSFFNRNTQKAEPIAGLIKIFEQEGNVHHPIPNEKFVLNNSQFTIRKSQFSSTQWASFDEATQQTILMEYRLAFCGYGEVNWCEALGTVLANDEVVNGVSERGGHPVEKKKLRQWYLRITEYADRLLEGLKTVDFSEAMKEMQSNWIGKSSGAEITFAIKSEQGKVDHFTAYTTRPDTIFGVDFCVIAPELDYIADITSKEQKEAVENYLAYVKSRSERERMAEKKITGVFTGAYALNPFDGKEIPIWISEYVLAGYGTGAIMAVPCGDERDYKFAKHFNIPITNIIGDHFNGEEANPTKDAILQHSGFLNGMLMRDAMEAAIKALEEKGVGTRKVNYKMRDAAFSRQRYWGEPFPIKWINGIAYALNEGELPLTLPEVESYSPGPEGEGPLANITDWTARQLETNTMPGYAGSSWYFLRYMDPQNDEQFASREATDYWNQVDLYIGGTEHAVGHLLYSRMWTKVLHDLGHIGFDEPFKKLVNQGMVQGSSRFVYRINGTNQFVSHGLIDANHEYKGQLLDKIHVDVNFVDGVELDRDAFKKWKNAEFGDAEFLLEDGKYICGTETEKMSKTKYNTVNPDDLVEKYGADTFRMYEMFLGPVEMSKPWDTKGIEGVHRFLKKLWRLFYKETNSGESVWQVNEDAATAAELKVLHRAIKKIEDDTERFSFNTGVSGFMILVNELTDLKCHKREILEPMLVMLAPYAPHIAEELWHALGNTSSVIDANYPGFEEKYLVETSKEYPISINGKMRTTMHISLSAEQQEIETLVLANDVVQKWIDGKTPKKIIYVKNKMVNIVV